jgi:hypothetical protein
MASKRVKVKKRNLEVCILEVLGITSLQDMAKFERTARPMRVNGSEGRCMEKVFGREIVKSVTGSLKMECFSDSGSHIDQRDIKVR